MKIKEVEKITGITSKNIRFYEKEGLLLPGRNAENKYREYSSEDVKRLKEIKLLRKFGMSLTDIKGIQDGSLEFAKCLQRYRAFYIEKKKEMEILIELATDIQKNEPELSTLDADFYLAKIDSAEEAGAKFTNIARDFINKAKGVLPLHAPLFFEPEEPIMNPFDFVKELEYYAKSKDLPITILKMGMSPSILLGDKKYRCTLEMPRMLHFPLSIFFQPKFNLGYRFVYLYEAED